MDTPLLQIDLNEIASKEITAKINGLESQIESMHRQLNEQRAEINKLKKDNESLADMGGLMDLMKAQYAKISNIKVEGYDGNEKRSKDQFSFITQIMYSTLGIETDIKWLGGNLLIPNLVLKYVDHRDVLLKVCKVIFDKDAYYRIEKFVKDFVLPQNYRKDQIIKFLQRPHDVTNGEYFGMSRYWREAGLGEKNAPYSLLMKNPAILQEDVFQVLIETLKKRGNNFGNLYAYPEYNKDLSPVHIRRMGETLIGLKEHELKHGKIDEFIKLNMNKFSTEVQGYLMGVRVDDNYYSTYYWAVFDRSLQEKYLLSQKSMARVWHLLNESRCGWTEPEKEAMIAKYVDKVRSESNG